MIFLTVGTQLPFDRLVILVEEWMSVNETSEKVVAQIGDSKFKSKTMTVYNDIPPKEFMNIFSSASIIIAHAGMGSILTALKLKKPIIIFPRQASLGEHRNDHQLSTVKSFINTPGVYVAMNKEDLFNLLDKAGDLVFGDMNNSDEYLKLIEYLENIIYTV